MTRRRANEGPTRARLLIASKLTLGSGYIEEVKVWSLPVAAWNSGISSETASLRLFPTWRYWRIGISSRCIKMSVC